MPKLDPHDPHLADILRRASLEREQQDQRLADIFGTQTVPNVTEETLAIYLNYLKQHLSWLRVFRSAHTAHLGHGVGQER